MSLLNECDAYASVVFWLAVFTLTILYDQILFVDLMIILTKYNSRISKINYIPHHAYIIMNPSFLYEIVFYELMMGKLCLVVVLPILPKKINLNIIGKLISSF